MKIAYQGVSGSYSESCAKTMYPNCETLPCKTFDECFEKAKDDSEIRALIPESNKTTGNIGCLLYTSPSPRDATLSRMPSSA